MQPNHYHLLGQVRDPRAASQLMRDGQSREQSGQPRPSGAAPMRSEGMFAGCWPFYTRSCSFSLCRSSFDMHALCPPCPLTNHVLTTILHRLLDRGVLAAIVFVTIFGRHKRRYHHHRSPGRASPGRHVPTPQSAKTSTTSGGRHHGPGRLLVAGGQSGQQQSRRIRRERERARSRHEQLQRGYQSPGSTCSAACTHITPLGCRRRLE